MTFNPAATIRSDPRRVLRDALLFVVALAVVLPSFWLLLGFVKASRTVLWMGVLLGIVATLAAVWEIGYWWWRAPRQIVTDSAGMTITWRNAATTIAWSTMDRVEIDYTLRRWLGRRLIITSSAGTTTIPDTAIANADWEWLLTVIELARAVYAPEA